jgi:phenol 2-monooxygenase
LTGLTVADSGEYPVTVTLRGTDARREGEEVLVRARYVVGCDGARSVVRQSIGRELQGDVANHAWGVMDILAVTDFPDIRIKAAIQSAIQGNIVLIPREGGYLVRLYVDLGEVDPDDRRAVRTMSCDEVIRRIAAPAHARRQGDHGSRSMKSVNGSPTTSTTCRSSAPPTRSPHVFIAGGACHAQRQGGPGYERVDAGRVQPRLEARRRARGRSPVAAAPTRPNVSPSPTLIDFDKEWSAIMASPPKDGESTAAASTLRAAGVLRESLGTRRCRRYTPSTLTAAPTPAPRQGIHDRDAVPFRSSRSPRRRQANAARALPSRRRPLAAVRLRRRRGPASSPHLRALCEHLQATHPTRSCTAHRQCVRCAGHVPATLRLRLEDLPSLLLPHKGHTASSTTAAFTPDWTTGAGDIFDLRGIDRGSGALIVARPDQYVAHVLPLDAYDNLTEFFAPLMREL